MVGLFESFKYLISLKRSESSLARMNKVVSGSRKEYDLQVA